MYVCASFATVEHEIIVGGHLGTHPFTTRFLHMQLTMSFISKWPSAQEHPFCYICIFAVIGLGAAFININPFIVQSTGALRALKVLVRDLVVTIIRATM